MEYKKYKLGEIANFSQGKQVEISEQYEVHSENMKRFIRIVDYTNINEPFRYVENYADKYYASENELVMIRYGSQTAGMVVMGKNGIIANNLFKINLNNNIVLNRYMYYYLSQKSIIAYLRGAQSSSTMPAISFSLMNNLEVKIPDIQTQKKIINILDGINQKIELNNRINNNLLEMIDSIYKNDFSELNEFESAECLADISIGKTPPRNIKECFSTNVNDIKWVSISDLGKCGTYINNTNERLTLDAVNKYNVKILPKETVILSFKLTVGRVAITRDEMATNEAIAHFNLKDKEMKYYIYSYLKNFDFSRLGNTSSIATAVNSKIIKAMPIAIPNKEQLIKFNKKVTSIFTNIKNNEIQNEILAQLREILLPKLMNGEINLDNVKI